MANIIAPEYRMRVYVFRSADGADCTNNGLTSHFSTVLIVGDGYEQGTARADCPAFRLREKGGRVHAYPADIPEGDGRYSTWMFGGNFLYCSDSRFPMPYPIPVHDRREG